MSFEVICEDCREVVATDRTVGHEYGASRILFPNHTCKPKKIPYPPRIGPGLEWSAGWEMWAREMTDRENERDKT